ncbi:gluconate:H+ symporter [Limnovirga soli]|uniref:Gluconate transporter n=1 Tax=Limnovirga soli TaxID=2656915 RepID=A0A8J8JRG7_9BACT|nr:gluconate:H+ symporter [Limnovirga soli]NNV55847.1 gluconate transporter [Limnovirga soli]
MSLIILLLGIVLLVLLITWARLNAFLSFIIVAILIALFNGMQVPAIAASLQKGIGDLLGSVVIILGLGAMLGKLVAESGAAQKIADGLMKAFGQKYLIWALVLTAFIIGIPLFYNVGFVLMVPLIITISAKYKLPAVYVGLPMLAALSVTHGYLPPHPSPLALVSQYHADLGLTMLYGFIVAIPAIVIAGPIFGSTLKQFKSQPLAAFAGKEIPEHELPGLFTSLFTAFLPVILIAVGTIIKLMALTPNVIVNTLIAISDPIFALTITIIVAIYTLGINRGKSVVAIMGSLTDAVKDIAMIILIIGGAGALKQVLTDTGISNQIAGILQGMQIHPLLAAWSIAAIIRVCLGSATVAGLTAAGIVAPLIAATGVNPNLMVLATGAGSLMFSHVNDPGFWLFKEYFNLSFKDTIKTWSIMETIVSVVGIIAVFILSYFI